MSKCHCVWHTTPYFTLLCHQIEKRTRMRSSKQWKNTEKLDKWLVLFISFFFSKSHFNLGYSFHLVQDRGPTLDYRAAFENRSFSLALFLLSTKKRRFVLIYVSFRSRPLFLSLCCYWRFVSMCCCFAIDYRPVVGDFSLCLSWFIFCCLYHHRTIWKNKSIFGLYFIF